MKPDAALIAGELRDAGQAGVGLHLFDRLDSTSVWLRERAKDLHTEALITPEFDKRADRAQVCVTDWQTAGIARRGRTWQTKPGNMTFSMLTQTKHEAKNLMGLSLVTGIAVATCLRDEYDLDLQLKWPNDVLVNNAKVGGLLTELLTDIQTGSQVRTCQVLTGIGINVLHDSEVIKLGIGGTSLYACGVDLDRLQRDALIGKLVASVLSAHQLFFVSGWEPFAEQWESFDCLFDKQVSIFRQESTEHAVARGVNDQGALLVERAGQVQPLYSGNISIRPIV